MPARNRGHAQLALLGAFEAAEGPIPSPELTRRVYGSDDLCNRRALITAIYHLRRARPDLTIETVGRISDGRRWQPVSYRLVAAP